MAAIPILVTGGAGYVGSHACKALAAAGYLPVTYDSLERGHRWAVKWGPLETGSLGDAARLRAVLAQYRPAAAMHFAAYALVGESMSDPALYYRNNVGGTFTLLEEMRTAGITRLVFSSSCATYGMPLRTPIPESHPQNPVNPYGNSKLAAERMLADYGSAYGLGWTALRYFNAAGADPDAEIGEAHAPETHLVPCVLDAASGQAPAIRVNGTDYDTPDGTCIRDYVHVCDLADAHLKALGRLLEGGESCAVNLGTGVGHSVRQVIETAQRVTGRAIPVVHAPRRPGDPPVLVADAALAGRLLGWTPRRASLDVQVADAWRWHERGRRSVSFS